MKYKYYIFNNDIDYFKVMFADIVDDDNVEYIGDPSKYYNFGNIKKKLYDWHYSPYLNYFFNIPFKYLWNTEIFKNNNDLRPKCFVFLMGWLVNSREPFFKFLKRKYKDCKLVLYFEDLVSSRSSLNLGLIDKYFDLVLTYDKGDADKFHFVYCPTFLSKISGVSSKGNIFDVCFVGAAKNRYDCVMNLYQYLTSKGLKCDFTVAFLQENQIKIQGVNYIDNQMSYIEYLQHVLNSRCILEIQQDGAVGFTLRTWEALLYGKKMITNNKSILKADFYSPSQFLYFSTLEDIDVKFVREENCFDTESYKGILSPINFLNIIENNI